MRHPLYWGEVVEADNDFVKIRLSPDNHSTGVEGTKVVVFIDKEEDEE